MANIVNTSSTYQTDEVKCKNTDDNKSCNSDVGFVSSLKDIHNFLQKPIKMALDLKADAASYEHVVEKIRGLDLQDDGIEMNRKIKNIEVDFCNIVNNEDVLCETMEYINNRALGDADTSLKFAMLFSSRSFDALAMNETKVRSTMLKILETNFINAEIYRTEDKNRLYNSITMLGEYYHRVRLADNSPVHILGESLLQLLQSELSDTKPVDVRLAKLVLSQITLNGRLLRTRHQPQLMQLFYHIRRQLIEQPTLSATVKALLLMTLDMYYSNFEEINKWLEDMYTEYFLQGEKEADFLTQEEALTTEKTISMRTNGSHRVFERSTSENNPLESQPNDILPQATKKWSEQVCEDTYENIFDEICNNVWNENSKSNEALQSSIQSEQIDKQQEESYGPYIETKTRNKHGNEQKLADVADKNQHFPRWRAPRFNRDNKETRNDKPRRYSSNQDSNELNGHSEENNIRLYSINDRLKHSQEKNDRIMATSGGSNKNYYNASSIANSNWDRQSQHDDRSERSYVSNYERGHQQRGRQKNDGSRYFNNNKQTFDKPPRFQKHHQKSGHVDSWRKSSNSPAFANSSDSYESHGRRSSYAFTLPRQSKTIPDRVDNFIIPSLSYRRRSSQSPSGSHSEFGKVNNYRSRHKNHQNNSNQYDSQSSLASEASSVYMNRQYSRQFQSAERQLHPRNNKTRRNNNNNKNVPNDEQRCKTNNAPDGNDVDDEIVKNARQTADYMNYLSQK